MGKDHGPNMPPARIVDSMARFKDLRVLVVGDFFVDEYLEGLMFEISKEGPIPVIRRESLTQTAGAAGNLASSIRNLGAGVSVVGVAGDDANGGVILSQLRSKGIRVSGLIRRKGEPTFTYTKVRARVESSPSKEVFRLDTLPDGPAEDTLEKEVIAAVGREARGMDAIIVLDQVHHLVSRGLLRALPKIARSAGALLHGSSREHIGSFSGFDLITPNDREAQGAVGGGPNGAGSRDIVAVGKALKTSGRHRKVMLTLGPDGMALFADRAPVERMPTFARSVVDVTGAGDAVSSVAVLGNALGWDLKSLAWAASHAAAIAVEHVGTHHVTREELRERIFESS